MTKKELMYVEDAIKHEKSIIKIVDETINNLESKTLKTFLEKELKKHAETQRKLISLLEEKENE